ncbi:VCBS repeat-containing protein [Pseudophaeobacter sp.]|uniref:FG-GAP repeat domain-containing protein n=1 Tax=Pseudophaeobacter sp. TaxID=1971739 RepID=UPI003297C51E
MRTSGAMARRLMFRPWPGSARRAGQALCLWLVTCVASAPLMAAGSGADGTGQSNPGWTDEIFSAEFARPTTAYAHGVLGDAVEWAWLTYSYRGKDQVPRALEIRLPADHVFEDLKPRLVDLNLDGRANAVMVVETDMAGGAALALYGAGGKIAETPHIGRRNRWLAPIGAADLDGDGHVEIAYVDRPHLARTLRIWRFQSGELREVAAWSGLTNHRIGDDFITSGLRSCGSGPELVLVDAQWQSLVAARLVAGQIEIRVIAPFTGTASLEAALSCQ